MSLGKPEYVSDLVVYLLHQLGVEYVTLNPGATTRGMHESLVTYGGNTAPEVIACSHEEIAVAMAEGYYLATGKPQAVLVHNIVGLQHASKAIYEAWLNQVPMIVIGGTWPLDSTHRRPWIDWIHTAQVQGQIVRDYPMLVIMFNNRAYHQDVGHQRAITTMRQRSLENVGVGVSLERPA